jgi:SIR2-like domain
MPTAATISVRETLELLDGPFAELSDGVAQGRYAFWLGSGISRERIDDLKQVIKKVLAHLQTRIDPADANCRFRRALEEALELAQLSADERAGCDLSQPVDAWRSLDAVLQRLAKEYSRLLDIRVGPEAPDYLLWEGVDVPNTFAPAGAEPDCEHLCLGVLAVEGVVPDIVSANWDGLVEAALLQLTDGAGDVLLVCVRSEDLREPRRRTRLVKFHGCAVRAAADPAVYRQLIIARYSQITEWPFNLVYRPIRDQLVNLAVTSPTLMIGLSAQDTNIQHVFAEAQARMEWPWPSHPPAHVFAEDTLGVDQRNILRYVYRAAYDANGPAVEVSALLRAFAKPLLVALVLHVTASKLLTLLALADAPGLPVADRTNLGNGVIHFRNRIAAAADGDRLAFIRSIVAFTSRGLSLFREGRPPAPGSPGYRAIGAVPLHQIAAEPNLQTSGLRELATAIGLLGWGEMQNDWLLNPGVQPDGQDGVLRIGPPGTESRVYFMANSEAALALEIEGIVSEDHGDAVIVHSTAPVARLPRSPRLAPGRTGVPTARHVDMGELLRDSHGIGELHRRFREEAVI